MSLSILNNIAALYAQNNLSSTQSSLQNTLNQLSSGSRINSGADDASGLAVADGLHANEMALTQSAQNASSGIGLLQTADGSLSQVTNLLDRAVTLATESANGTLTGAQVSSANQEYQNILSQIGNIGSTSNFNSSAVFSASATNIVVTDGTSGGLNTYADTIGVLAQSSVGTTAGAAITTGNAATAFNPPMVAVPNQAGTYSLTAANNTDTLGGTLSWTIGNSTTVNSITIAAGSSLATVAGQLSHAGLNSTATGKVITITGPINGADAAADTVNFTSNVSDTPVATTLTSAAGTTAQVAQAATGTLSVANASGANDTFAGTITLTQAGNQSSGISITIAPGSKYGSANSAGTIENQIATQLAGTGFSLSATESGTPAGGNVGLTFTGAASTTAVTVGGTFKDTTNSGSVTWTDSGGAGGTGSGTGSLTISGATSDGVGGSNGVFGGTIVLKQGGATKTITIAPNSNLGMPSDPSSVEGQITTQLASTPWSLSADTGTGADPVFNFVGTNNSSAITIDSSSTFSGANPSAATVSHGGAAGTAIAQGTFTLGTLAAADTYGNTAANALTINGAAPISLAGLTNQQAVLAINNNGAMQAAGITASLNSAGTILTITGKSDGSALTVLGNGGAALSGAGSLTDQAPNSPAITTVAQVTAPIGVAAAGATSVITLGSATDTVSGALNLKVNSGGSEKDAALTLAQPTNGQGLANLINANLSYQAAGLSAVWNASKFTVTITGPTGAGNAIADNASTLKDTTSAAPGKGADFTAAGVSTLTSATAANILTTVTSAIADVAYQRGTLGADINQLTSASNVASSESVNLTSAEQNIRATDYGQAASQLSKYQILSQTGISALAQANSVQQEVLKLLQ